MVVGVVWCGAVRCGAVRCGAVWCVGVVLVASVPHPMSIGDGSYTYAAVAAVSTAPSAALAGSPPLSKTTAAAATGAAIRKFRL